MSQSEDPRSVLITGCSTGFGRVTARHLARRGWQVYATVRKETDRQSLLDEAAAFASQKGAVMPVVFLCDITDDRRVAQLGGEVASASPKLDALVNNAGTAFPSPLELLPPSELRKQFDVNVVAHLAVTQAVMPLLKAARGTIINVSSISGRITGPITGAYSASKFALEAISDAMRIELARFGVKVVLIEPGSSPTAIWNTSLERGQAGLQEGSIDASAYQPLIDEARRRVAKIAESGFPPQLFAETVERILNTRRPRARYPVPASFALLIALRRLMPDELWDRLVRRAVNW